MSKDNKTTIFASKFLRGLLLVTTLVVLTYFVSDKLIFGARWSSGLHLGGIDNYLSGGTMYPTSTASITAGSSYFPGVMLLAYIFRSLFGFGADTAFIIFGAVSWLLMAYSFATLSTNVKNTRFLFFVIAVWFFISQFPAARHYLLEVHPDIPSLICFLWGVLMLPEKNTEKKVLRYFVVVALFYFSGLFKQNSAFLYFGLGLYVLFSKTLTKTEKLYIIICEVIAGSLLIITILYIDGCWLNCVTINSKHHYMNWRWVMFYIQNVIKYDCVFLLLAVYSLYLIVKKKITLSQKEKMWLSSSLAWTAFCLFGSIKKGADDGNMEAGFVSLMPFVLCAISYIFTLFKCGVVRMSPDKKSSVRCSNITFCIIALILIGTIGECAIKISGNYELYHKRLIAQQNFSEWLSTNYKGKNIAYNTCVYEFINNADVIKKSDINTIEVWQWADLVSDDIVKQISEAEDWDLIMTLRGIDGHYWPRTFDSFELVDETLYPSINNFVPSKVDLYVRKRNREI